MIPAAESLRIAGPNGRLTGSIGWPARSAFCCPSFRADLDLMAPFSLWRHALVPLPCVAAVMAPGATCFSPDALQVTIRKQPCALHREPPAAGLLSHGPGPCTRVVVPFAGAISICPRLISMRMRVSWLSPFHCWPASFWWGRVHRLIGGNALKGGPGLIQAS